MNMSIKCNVLTCKYNEENEHYCTLNQIEVTQHDNGIDQAAYDTDCASYEPRR